MAKNTWKVREKSGNFVSPEKWEPCLFMIKHKVATTIVFIALAIQLTH